THAAAGWALRRWQLPLPELAAADEPISGHDWFVSRSGLTMVRIPPGTFTMGDRQKKNAPLHQVTLKRAYFISDREVPVDLFRQFLDDRNYLAVNKPKAWPEFPRAPVGAPVNQVNWFDALLFCNWLSQREGREICYYRGSPLQTGNGQ